MIATDMSMSLHDIKEDGNIANDIKMAETLADTSKENIKYSDDDVDNELILQNQ